VARLLALLPGAETSSPRNPAPGTTHRIIDVRAAGERHGEADMLPVRSNALTPGSRGASGDRAPGLAPAVSSSGRMTNASRAWLRQRWKVLRELGASPRCNAKSQAALDGLTRLAPDLIPVPVSADDLATTASAPPLPLLITPRGYEHVIMAAARIRGSPACVRRSSFNTVRGLPRRAVSASPTPWSLPLMPRCGRWRCAGLSDLRQHPPFFSTKPGRILRYRRKHPAACRAKT